MGVDTKAIIRKGVTLPEIKMCLEEKYGEVVVHNTHADYFFVLGFSDGEGKRNLNVFFRDLAKSDYGIEGVLLSLGSWGNSIEIMKTLLGKFGGYLDKNDCDDKGFEPYNPEEYLKGDDMSRHDAFTLEVIHKLGFDKLQIAMELFEKYKKIEAPH